MLELGQLDLNLLAEFGAERGLTEGVLMDSLGLPLNSARSSFDFSYQPSSAVLQMIKKIGLLSDEAAQYIAWMFDKPSLKALKEGVGFPFDTPRHQAMYQYGKLLHVLGIVAAQCFNLDLWRTANIVKAEYTDNLKHASTLLQARPINVLVTLSNSTTEAVGKDHLRECWNGELEYKDSTSTTTAQRRRAPVGKIALLGPEQSAIHIALLHPGFLKYDGHLYQLALESMALGILQVIIASRIDPSLTDAQKVAAFDAEMKSSGLFELLTQHVSRLEGYTAWLGSLRQTANYEQLDAEEPSNIKMSPQERGRLGGAIGGAVVSIVVMGTSDSDERQKQLDGLRDQAVRGQIEPLPKRDAWFFKLKEGSSFTHAFRASKAAGNARRNLESWNEDHKIDHASDEELWKRLEILVYYPRAGSDKPFLNAPRGCICFCCNQVVFAANNSHKHKCHDGSEISITLEHFPDLRRIEYAHDVLALLRRSFVRAFSDDAQTEPSLQLKVPGDCQPTFEYLHHPDSWQLRQRGLCTMSAFEVFDKTGEAVPSGELLCDAAIVVTDTDALQYTPTNLVQLAVAALLGANCPAPSNNPKFEMGAHILDTPHQTLKLVACGSCDMTMIKPTHTNLQRDREHACKQTGQREPNIDIAMIRSVADIPVNHALELVEDEALYTWEA